MDALAVGSGILWSISPTGEGQYFGPDNGYLASAFVDAALSFLQKQEISTNPSIAGHLAEKQEALFLASRTMFREYGITQLPTMSHTAEWHKAFWSAVGAMRAIVEKGSQERSNAVPVKFLSDADSGYFLRSQQLLSVIQSKLVSSTRDVDAAWPMSSALMSLFANPVQAKVVAAFMRGMVARIEITDDRWSGERGEGGLQQRPQDPGSSTSAETSEEARRTMHMGIPGPALLPQWM